MSRLHLLASTTKQKNLFNLALRLSFSKIHGTLVLTGTTVRAVKIPRLKEFSYSYLFEKVT